MLNDRARASLIRTNTQCNNRIYYDERLRIRIVELRLFNGDKITRDVARMMNIIEEDFL